MNTIVELLHVTTVRDSTTPSARLALAPRAAAGEPEPADVSPTYLPARRPAPWLMAASPVVAAVLTMVFYASIIGVHIATGGDLRDFIQIGTRFVSQSHASQTIRMDPRYHYLSNRHGYDGQFYYYIALDPLKARFYIDWSSLGRDAAAYRYSRILYPLLARTLALGRGLWIPFTLLLVNVLGVGLGTLSVAAWLRRFGVMPWLAALYSFYPGVSFGVLLDLADPLAFSFTAAGAYLLYFAGRYRLAWAGVLFALAGLTRDTTLLVPCVYGLWFLSQRQLRNGIMLGLLASAPALLWRVCLSWWVGSLGLPRQDAPVLPFTGLLSQWTAARVLEAFVVVVPALLLGLLAIRAWRAGGRSPEMLVLAANILVLVVLLNPSSYIDLHDSARVTIGVVLFALLSLPSFLTSQRIPSLVALGVCSILWAIGLVAALVTPS